MLPRNLTSASALKNPHRPINFPGLRSDLQLSESVSDDDAGESCQSFANPDCWNSGNEDKRTSNLVAGWEHNYEPESDPAESSILIERTREVTIRRALMRA